MREYNVETVLDEGAFLVHGMTSHSSGSQGRIDEGRSGNNAGTKPRTKNNPWLSWTKTYAEIK
jgi:hypothetical protein